MNLPTFEDFRAAALAQGFGEVLERNWSPGQELPEHTHPFDVHAVVVRGEVTLGEGSSQRVLHAGDTFDVPRGTPHSERYGPEGATFWVARRH